MASKDTNSTTTEPETVPVKYLFKGSLRRSNIGNPPKFAHLRKKLAKSFPDYADVFQDKKRPLKLVYTDDEGDECTITTNDELLTAYRLAQQAGKVLRFVVPEFEEPTTVEAVAEEGPVAADAVKEQPQQDSAATDTTTPSSQTEKTEKAAAASPISESSNHAQAIVDAIVAGVRLHFGHVCNKTGQTPIVGERYACRDDPNCSISENAYAALDPEDQKRYALAEDEPSYPNSRRGFNARLPRYVIAQARWMGVPVHRGVRCDATGLKPILGNRYQLKGQNYDLCQFAYDQLSDADKEQYVLIDGKNLHQPPGHRGGHRGHRRGGRHGRHPRGSWRAGGQEPTEVQPVHFGVSCDASGMCPIVGNRWHKSGENYDLCEAEYQKLSDADKTKFVCISEPQRGFFAFGPGGFGGFHGRFRGRGRGPQGHCGFGFGFGGRNRGPGSGFGGGGSNAGAAAAGKGPDVKQGDKANAQFVKDLTVNDRSRKAPGEVFEKAWVMRAGKNGVPAGCSLVFIGGHDLSAPALRIPIENAPIATGNEFVLKTQFTAPTKPGHYRSFWRLQTPAGRRFGPRIWADIMVKAASAKSSGNGAAQSMKFSKDLTVPDGSVVEINSKLRKTWLVETNSGWGEGVELRCTDMWSSWAGLKEAVPAVPSGSQAELSITLQVPCEAGHYRTYWALFGPDGTQIGDSLFVDFQAVDAVTDAADAATANTSSAVAADAPAQDVQSEGNSTAESTSVAVTQPAGNADILQQILAGIETAPDSEKQALSTKLFQGLQNQNYNEVIAALRAFGIEIKLD